MESNWEENIVRHRQMLEESIDPDFGLLDQLLALGVLSRLQYSNIKVEHPFQKRNALLLDYCTDAHTTEGFIRALRDTNQGHLVNYVLSNGEYFSQYGSEWPLTKRERSILDSNHKSLVDLLDMHELLVQLYSASIINKRHLDYISSKSTDFEKNEVFFDILYRKSLADYCRTIQCLQESHQAHIAKVLDHGLVVVQFHAEISGPRETDFDEARKPLEEHHIRSSASFNTSETQTDFQDVDITAGSQNDLVLYERCHPERAVTSTNSETQTDFQHVGSTADRREAESQTDVNISCSAASQDRETPSSSSEFRGLEKNFDYKTALNKCCALFLDCLDVKHGLLDHLVAKGVLTKRQQEAVEAERPELMQINKLIDLLNRGGFDHFQKFLKILHETSQEHVTNMIISNGDIFKISTAIRPLERSELNLLDGYRTILIKGIDADLILDQMLEAKCITYNHLVTIKESVWKSRTLVDIIRRGSLESFNQFKEIVSKTHNNGISEVFKPNPDLSKLETLKPVKNRNPDVEALAEENKLLSLKLDVVEQERDLAKQERLSKGSAKCKRKKKTQEPPT